jgi:hypothetical protein
VSQWSRWTEPSAGDPAPLARYTRGLRPNANEALDSPDPSLYCSQRSVIQIGRVTERLELCDLLLRPLSQNSASFNYVSQRSRHHTTYATLPKVVGISEAVPLALIQNQRRTRSFSSSLVAFAVASVSRSCGRGRGSCVRGAISWPPTLESLVSPLKSAIHLCSRRGNGWRCPGWGVPPEQLVAVGSERPERPTHERRKPSKRLKPG